VWGICGKSGNTGAKWNNVYSYTDDLLKRASGGNFATNNNGLFTVGSWNHVVWSSDGVNDYTYINGNKSAIGTMGSPVTIMDVLFGCMWTTDDPNTGGPKYKMTGSFRRGWYFERELLPVEVAYLYDNEL
jgi:hypothetical protein